VEFAAELQAGHEEFTASGIVEVREQGGCVVSRPRRCDSIRLTIF
jgi:hypothetical protein